MDGRTDKPSTVTLRRMRRGLMMVLLVVSHMFVDFDREVFHPLSQIQTRCLHQKDNNHAGTTGIQ